MRLVVAILAVMAVAVPFDRPAADHPRIAYPESYRGSFLPYAVRARPDLDQVRHLFANPLAVDAIRNGEPLPHGAMFVAEIYATRKDAEGKPVRRADGRHEAGEVLFLAVMQSGPGWGQRHPREIRNGDWNFAAFDPATGMLDATRAEATCLECHRPMTQTQFVFSYDALVARVRALPRDEAEPASIADGADTGACPWSTPRTPPRG
jgi:hypothetical protein